MTDAERNAALARELAGAGDVISELLGLACARGARGDFLAPEQVTGVREAILAWHRIRGHAAAIVGR